MRALSLFFGAQPPAPSKVLTTPAQDLQPDPSQRAREQYGDMFISAQASSRHDCDPPVDGLPLNQYRTVDVALFKSPRPESGKTKPERIRPELYGIRGYGFGDGEQARLDQAQLGLLRQQLINRMYSRGTYGTYPKPPAEATDGKPTQRVETYGDDLQLVLKASTADQATPGEDDRPLYEYEAVQATLQRKVGTNQLEAVTPQDLGIDKFGMFDKKGTAWLRQHELGRLRKALLEKAKSTE